jgi:hypothetical protein
MAEKLRIAKVLFAATLIVSMLAACTWTDFRD